MHVIEPGCCTYYVDSIRFRDDPPVQEDDQASANAPGGSGLVDPQWVDRVWHVERDIVLPSREDR